MLAAHRLDRFVPVPPSFAPTRKASFPPIGLSCLGLILSSRFSSFITMISKDSEYCRFPGRPLPYLLWFRTQRLWFWLCKYRFPFAFVQSLNSCVSSKGAHSPSLLNRLQRRTRATGLVCVSTSTSLLLNLGPSLTSSRGHSNSTSI